MFFWIHFILLFMWKVFQTLGSHIYAQKTKLEPWVSLGDFYFCLHFILFFSIMSMNYFYNQKKKLEAKFFLSPKALQLQCYLEPKRRAPWGWAALSPKPQLLCPSLPSYALNCVPLIFVCWSPNFSHIWRGIWKEAIKVKWGHKNGALIKED